MAMMMFPIAWFLEALRLWRIREQRVLAEKPLDEAGALDLHHERNTSIWYLLPPC